MIKDIRFMNDLPAAQLMVFALLILVLLGVFLFDLWFYIKGYGIRYYWKYYLRTGWGPTSMSKSGKVSTIERFNLLSIVIVSLLGLLVLVFFLTFMIFGTSII